VRHLLDRDGVARDGPVHRAAPRGARAEIPAAGRGRALLRAAGDRRGLDRLRLDRIAAKGGLRLLLLAREPGPGIHEHGPRVAAPPLRGPPLLGIPPRARALAGAAQALREPRARRDGVP